MHRLLNLFLCLNTLTIFGSGHLDPEYFFKPIPERSEHCNEFGMCKNPKGYPEMKILSAVRKAKGLQSYFGNIYEPYEGEIEFNNRFGGENSETEVPACTTIDRTIFPRQMMDTEEVSSRIVNVEGFDQGIKFQTCSQGGHRCNQLLNVLNYESKCVQEYQIIKLVAFNEESENVEYRDFKVPSNCVCVYSKKFY